MKEFQTYYPGLDPILVFDSYYTDTAGRKWLNENKIKFIAAVQTERFKVLMDFLWVTTTAKVTKPGQTEAIFCPASGELFVHHWDLDAVIGKKYVLTNALKLVAPKRGSDSIVPGYDHYGQAFNACDRFNRKLHDKKYPHKTGGRNTAGEAGHIHKFIMACIVQNTLAAGDKIAPKGREKLTYLNKCCQLSDELFAYAISNKF